MKFYRYDDVWRSSGVPYILRRLYLLKKTPRGWWISDYGMFCEGLGRGYSIPCNPKKRWVSAQGLKRFAYPSEVEAMNNYKARKRRQIRILTTRLDSARNCLFHAENGKHMRSQGLEFNFDRGV